MKVLGIDPSLTHIGICLLNEKGVVLDKRTFLPKEKFVNRLHLIYNFIKEYCLKNAPDLVVLEGYSFHPFAGNVVSLGELGGILKLALKELNIRFFIVAPLTLKKFVLGKGKGDKNQILLGVYKKWNVEFEDDHQTDAFVLAQIGLCYLTKTPLVKYEKEVLDKILKNEENLFNNKEVL